MPRILIVEDHDESRVVMRLVLEQHGHQVHEAADGARGVELAAALRPDVALIDVGLPGLDGYEVARRIRSALGPAIRLVAITGYGRDQDRAEALGAGFDMHLLKPVSADALAEILGPPPGEG